MHAILYLLNFNFKGYFIILLKRWFQLVSEDGKAVTSADAFVVDIEDVAALRDAVFAKVSRVLPAIVIAADLTVFDENGAP